MANKELGALINMFWPAILGVFATVMFVIFGLIVKKSQPRLIVLIVLCLYLIYVGAALHFDKDYWPLVTW